MYRGYLDAEEKITEQEDAFAERFKSLMSRLYLRYFLDCDKGTKSSKKEEIFFKGLNEKEEALNDLDKYGERTEGDTPQFNVLDNLHDAYMYWLIRSDDNICSNHHLRPITFTQVCRGAGGLTNDHLTGSFPFQDCHGRST